jgi:hypothetical protein
MTSISLLFLYVTVPRDTIRFPGGISLCERTVKFGEVLSVICRTKYRDPELVSITA